MTEGILPETISGGNPNGGQFVKGAWGSAAWTASLLAGLITLAFFLTHLAPGDPARIVLGPNAQESAVANLRRDLGLERPLLMQFTRYASDMLSGRWGESWLAHRPVARELADHLRPTAAIGMFAVSFALGGALLINAVVFAVPALRVIIPIFRAGVAFPGVVVAMVCAVMTVRLLPADDGLLSYAAPGLAAGIYSACLMATLLYNRFAQIQQSSAYRAARALGMDRRYLFFRVLLANARSLLVTLTINQIGLLFFSTMIAERIFSIRGIGALLIRSIQGKDLPVVAALIFCNGLFFLCLQGAQAIWLPTPGETPTARRREIAA